MGQRHQIYFIFPMNFKINMFKDYNEEEVVQHNIVAMHHQWLYGQTAIKQLMYFLKYCKAVKDNDDEYHPLVRQYKSQDIPKLLSALYSTNPEGYYHGVCIEPKDLADDPNKGDNNDGITLIDLRDISNIKYCFMFLWDQENESADVIIEAYEPLTAKGYIDLYYPPGKPIHYFNNNDKGAEDSFRDENAFIVEEISKMATLMSKKEILELFPTLYDDHEYEIDHGEQIDIEE